MKPFIAPLKNSNKMPYVIGIALLIPITVVAFALGLPSFMDFRARQTSAEAKLNVRQLCRLQLRHHEQQRSWIKAGPLPSPMPKNDAVEFPADAAFDAMGFSPGKVRYQYEVTVEPEVVRCTARGDQDGDGVLATFSIAILKDSREITAIDIVDELE